MSAEPEQEQPKASKSALKKLEKEQKKAEQKAKREGNKVQQTQTAAVEEEEANNYGTLPLIQSTTRINRAYTKLDKLDESLAGQTVWVRGRVHNYRGKGNLGFIVLRQNSYSAQVVLSKGEHVSKGLLNFASKINKESLVDIEAVVTTVQTPLESTTQKNVELSLRQLWIVAPAISPLPIQISDAEVPQPILDAQRQELERLTKEIETLEARLATEDGETKKATEAAIEEIIKQKATATKHVDLSREQRLDNRVLDLRTTTNQSIFRLQSAVCQLFRESLLKKNFVEIHTPKLISAASEGGADVFAVTYFGGNAYLAQSPQLYKQMAICSDIERVFEIAPVFRAENSNTHRHMTEFMGLDMEMTIQEHYHEVLDVLDELFVSIFEGLAGRYMKEIDTVRKQFPCENLQFLKPSLRLKFPEAIALLREAGETIGDFDDLKTAQEKLLGKLVKDKYHTDFYILDKFPAAVRPFYTMADPEDSRYTNAYDFFLRGEEILSGGQRVHDSAMLEEKAKAKGVDIKTIKSYIEAFRYGAPPHGGGGIGLERVVMLYLGLDNIRKTSMFPRDPQRLTP